MNLKSERIIWIDWMKFLGIYFIVVGHFFPPGFQYIYTFNVPLFFIISGFLSKRETNILFFWNKIWFNFIVPMLIICFLNFIYRCFLKIYSDSFSFLDIMDFLFSVMMGFHSGVRECWFIYTLILIKVIYQYSSKLTILLWTICFIISAYFFNQIDHKYFLGINLNENYSSIINLCTSFPFFALGVYFNKYLTVFVNLRNTFLFLTLFCLSLFLIYICGRYNGNVWMYKNDYGGNLFLFFTGGISGTIAVFTLSKFIPVFPKIVSVVSSGTILLLGFNWNVITIIRRLIPDSSILDYLLAVFVVLAFVPFINFFRKNFPLLLGKYRIVK